MLADSGSGDDIFSNPLSNTRSSPLSPFPPPPTFASRAPFLINRKQEETILGYWKETDAFKEQLRRSEGRPEYVFYDGPPFATGLPHYGHILAGTIKDVVTRFACSTGHHVTRRFGWDCHGLPVEYEIDKKLEIKGSEDVMRLGIDKYNEVSDFALTTTDKKIHSLFSMFC